MNIRPAIASDAAGLAAVYAHAVLHGFGTFEETPPSPAELEGKRLEIVSLGLPYLVAETDGMVAGFAYAGPFRTRAAYRFTVEDSVYIHPDRQGRGVGRALLNTLVEDCRGLGVRQMLAVIGDSQNAGSIGLHRSLGFQDAGLLPAVGYKHGRWIDVVMMSLALNGGSTSAPDRPGLVFEPRR